MELIIALCCILCILCILAVIGSIRKKKYAAAIALSLLIIASCCALALLPRERAPEDDRSALYEESVPPEIIAPPEISPAPPSEEPALEKTSWLLSFAGDCTIGTLHEWQGTRASNNMLHIMGEDYSYPLSAVAEIFLEDDFTMVNLEGAFTNLTQPVSKPFRFRAPPEAAQVLSLGGVDAVTLANNHSGDYLSGGLSDTCQALDTAGVLYTQTAAPLIIELEGGLRLGIISLNCVEIDLAVGDVRGYMQRITPDYDSCVEAECDLIAAYIHWGWEYYTEPEGWMVSFAHELAELGCDMVIGSHPHVLQRYELYEETPIFYSLGNFCYGGHSAPDDMDSVIIQQEIILSGDGYALGKTFFIPCAISSRSDANDFRPVLYEEDADGFKRVMKKLGLS